MIKKDKHIIIIKIVLVISGKSRTGTYFDVNLKIPNWLSIIIFWKELSVITSKGLDLR